MIEMKKLLVYVISVFLLAGCASKPEIAEVINPTVDIDMTIEARIVAEVQAGVDATLVAQVTPTPVLPTDTPVPTNTPTPVPPSPTPTPDPRLFWDDFEAGTKPEWGMSGNFATVNGDLVVEQFLDGSLGNSTWNDYSVILNDVDDYKDDWEIQLRMQDRDNYMALKFTAGTHGHKHNWYWVKMVDGHEQTIPGAKGGYWLPDNNVIKIEAEGTTYRLFMNGERDIFFTDNTFLNGGIRLVVSGANITIGDFEVAKFP